MTQSGPPTLATSDSGGGRPCCKVGAFIEKSGCFALADSFGSSIWLEIEPVPLHMLDQQVEITGEQFGTELIWVRTIGPARN